MSRCGKKFCGARIPLLQENALKKELYSQHTSGQLVRPRVQLQNRIPILYLIGRLFHSAELAITVRSDRCDSLHFIIMLRVRWRPKDSMPVHTSPASLRRRRTESRPFFSLPSFSTWRATNARLNRTAAQCCDDESD